MNPNKQDVDLLHRNPKSLIVKYQVVIKTIVLRYIRLGFLKPHDKEDAIQYINEELLKKVPTIQKQYNERALFKTYFSVIVRNLCIQRTKRERKTKTQEIQDSDLVVNYEDTLTGLILNHELLRFEKVLKLFFKQRSKLELCLKLIYRVPVTYSDFTYYHPEFKESEYNEIIAKLKPLDRMTEKEIYNIITPILNECEKKNNTTDAIRKWIKLKIEELIKLMNGMPQRANYNEETLQILIEKYYHAHR